jgi:Flp pilus assembly secretin CpaC
MLNRWNSLVALMLLVVGSLTAGEAPAPAPTPAGGTDVPSVPQVQELLKSIPTVKVHACGNAVVMDGTVSTLLAKERVEKLASSFKGVVNLVTLDESAESNEILAKEVLQKIGLPGLTVKMVRGYVVLEGEVANDTDRKSAEAVAKTFSDKVVNNIALKDQMIEIDMAFVDMKLDKSVTIHHNPMEALESVGTTTNPAEALLSGGAQFKPYHVIPGLATWSAAIQTSFIFRFIENDNDNKVLNRPHLTTLSRQPATFQEGGEKGYQVINQQSANVVFKPFGIIIAVTPELTKDGKVRCTISFEFSTPDPASSSGLDFLTYRTSATSLLQQNESMIVSGVVQDIQQHFKKGVPFLMRVPMIGHFFSSHDDANTKRDLLLVITPRVPGLIQCQNSPSFAKEQMDRLDPANLRWTEQLNSNLLKQPTPEDQLRMKEKDRLPACPPQSPAKTTGQAETPWLPLEPATAAKSEPAPKAEVTSVGQ